MTIQTYHGFRTFVDAPAHIERERLIEACPKNIQITRWIEALKRKAVTERH